MSTRQDTSGLHISPWAPQKAELSPRFHGRRGAESRRQARAEESMRGRAGHLSGAPGRERPRESRGSVSRPAAVRPVPLPVGLTALDFRVVPVRVPGVSEAPSPVPAEGDAWGGSEVRDGAVLSAWSRPRRSTGGRARDRHGRAEAEILVSLTPHSRASGTGVALMFTSPYFPLQGPLGADPHSARRDWTPSVARRRACRLEQPHTVRAQLT